MPAFINKRAGRTLGLDIGSTSVKLLELGKSRGKYRVEHYGVEPLPENAVVAGNIGDVEGVGNAIRLLVRRCKARAGLAAVAVAGSAVITKTTMMAAGMNEDEVEELLYMEADRYIPYPLEEVALDFAIRGTAPGDEEQLEVLLVACRREHIEAREAALELGGLKAKVIDVEAHCMQRALELVRGRFAGPENGVIAVVDLGATMTTLSVLTPGGAPYTREQLFGGKLLTDEIRRCYDLSAHEAALAGRRGNLPDDYEARVLQPFREAVVQQVSRSLQFFYSSGDCDDVDHIVLAGGVASLAGLAELVASRLGRPCTPANPFAGMALSPHVDAGRLQADAPAMMIACGLALRGFD